MKIKAVEFVLFVGVFLNVQGLAQSKTEVDESLIVILNIREIEQLFLCLRKSSSGLVSQPYLTTDVWFEMLGYYVEPHKVTTADGYILTVFRVLKNSPLPQNQRPVIFMNHGLFGSSNQWTVQQGRNNLEAQALLNEGFEIWLGNCRGNRYSKRHVKLNPLDSPYWDFSWHEMGIYDVPAVIDKILKHTENSRVYYIGYSMGCSQYMVMLSERPDYNAKVRKAFLLAPAGILYGGTSPLRSKSSEFGKQRGYINNLFLEGEIGSHQNILKYFQRGLANFAGSCASTALFNCGLCANVMFYLAGFNPREMNYTAIPSFYKNYADTVASKCLRHYIQIINDPKSGDFKMFDYGEKKNKKMYGTSTPPKYNLSRITVPTYIYYGKGDNIVTPENVEELADEFAPGVIKEMNLIDKHDPTNMFNHLDFITSIHAYQHYIRPIMDVILRDYNLTKSRQKYVRHS